MTKFDKYISTTLPYATSIPHAGHMLEFVQADALSRYFRYVKGETVFFNIGLDEHGLKVCAKAAELGMDTKEFLNGLANLWMGFWMTFEIKPESFYRTTDPPHHSDTKEFWNQCMERGDLYKKQYSGKYCTGCESFKTKADLVDGKCPDHGTEPEIVSEENWFFRIEKYKPQLLNWLHENRDFLLPANKFEELKNIITAAEDISVSRLKKNVPWGITVPDDPDQVIYVWLEALLNYLFAIRRTGNDFESQYFIQLCGPDNLRFQGALFQTILESAGLPHTKKLLVHGTVLDAAGKKMSKSVGNVIDPMVEVVKYGLDAVRYYTLAGLQTYSDGSWIENDLINKYNSDLADDFGNLLARTLHLIETKNMVVMDPVTEFKMYVDTFVKDITGYWDNFKINDALTQTNRLVTYGNQYINNHKPWEKEADYVKILSNLHYLLALVNMLYMPVLSLKTHFLIEEGLREKKKIIAFQKINITENKTC